MAKAKIFFDIEDEDDTDNIRYFCTPCTNDNDKLSLASILRSPTQIIEESIKPLVTLVEDVATKVYIIKQQVITDVSHGLTLDELVALHLYTSEGTTATTAISFLLNETIRRQSIDEFQPWHRYFNLLLTALCKLPSIGHSCTVYRGVRSYDLSDNYRDDAPYTWWNFSSCLRSLDQMKSPTFLGKEGVRTVFKIDCFSGKRIPFSENDEVILMPGFHFRVVGKLRSLDDLNTIYVREVTPSSTDVFSLMPIVTVSVTSPKTPPLSPLITTNKKTQRSKLSSKSEKSLKSTAHRIMKMSQILNMCGDHVLDLSGKKRPIDDLKRTLTERLTEDVTILNLSQTRLTKEKVKVLIGLLRANLKLIELNLSYNPLGTIGCQLLTQTLCGNATLRTLNLYNTKLSCDSGQHLSDMLTLSPRLHSLHLGVNSLGNSGAKYLFSNDIHLSYLNICCNKIDQEGCQHLVQLLEKNQTLTHLDLGGNPIRDKGMKTIAKALMNNTTLIKLHTWHCQISDYEPIGSLLRANSTLKELDFEGNQIADQHLQSLLLTMKTNVSLEKLNISHNKLSDNANTSLQQSTTSRLFLVI